MRTIGVISDTHGLLRAEAVAALRGVDRIVHAGDVGGPEILVGLRGVAPVVAVRGNTDYGSFGVSLPRTEAVELADGVSAWVLHDIDELDLDPAAAGFSVVIFGHSHRPTVERRGGVLFFNPGAAGHRRFTLPVTVGLLEIGADGHVDARIVELSVD
jgi:putative phosphoesterase